MALANPLLQEGATAQDSDHALRLAAAERRAQCLAAGRTSMEEWRRQQLSDSRSALQHAQALQMQSSPAPDELTLYLRGSTQPLTSVPDEELGPLSDEALAQRLQQEEYAAIQGAPIGVADVSVLPAEPAEVIEAGMVVGSVLPVPPVPAVVISAPSAPSPAGRCACAGALFGFSCLLLATASVLIDFLHVGHFHLLHRMGFHPASHSVFKLCLATVVLAFVSCLIFKVRKMRHDSRNLSVEPARNFSCRKRALMTLCVILGLVLVRGAFLAAHGRLHLPRHFPGFRPHCHGHDGWQDMPDSAEEIEGDETEGWKADKEADAEEDVEERHEHEGGYSEGWEVDEEAAHEGGVDEERQHEGVNYKEEHETVSDLIETKKTMSDWKKMRVVEDQKGGGMSKTTVIV